MKMCSFRVKLVATWDSQYPRQSAGWSSAALFPLAPFPKGHPRGVTAWSSWTRIWPGPFLGIPEMNPCRDAHLLTLFLSPSSLPSPHFLALPVSMPFYLSNEYLFLKVWFAFISLYHTFCPRRANAASRYLEAFQPNNTTLQICKSPTFHRIFSDISPSMSHFPYPTAAYLGKIAWW